MDNRQRRGRPKAKNRGKAWKNKQKRSQTKEKRNKAQRVHGEYHCENCFERWYSVDTFIIKNTGYLYDGQQCPDCGYFTYAFSVSQLSVCKHCGEYKDDCRCEHRVYGFYSCYQCKKKWESAYTFIERGTGFVIYGQQCKGCKTENFAEQVEELLCPYCESNPCECDKRHIDQNKNHIQSLCGKCRHKSQPCSSFLSHS
eukprot:259468_1